MGKLEFMWVGGCIASYENRDSLPPPPREIMQKEDSEVCVISTRVLNFLLLRFKYKD